MNTNENRVKRVEAFVAHAFEAHPHYSFGDGTVMRDHSFRVRDIALQICADIPADTLLVELGALLHDIGKTHEADDMTLHARHEEYNLPVSEELIGGLSLSAEHRSKLRDIVSHHSDSVEMQIIEDADALAFPADQRLPRLFFDWVKEKGLEGALEKKISKFDALHFEVSRQIGKEWFEQLRQDWNL